jgi:signal transduction histidine kinase
MKKYLAMIAPLWLALGLLLPATAAVTPRQPTAPIELQHAVWSARDGAPSNINYIEQTADGWLWLGGDDGLYRFDGVKFELFQPRAGTFLAGGILRMGRLSDGRLWLTPPIAGVEILHDGILTTYTEADGLPPATVYKLLAEADGRLWAASSAGIYLLQPGAGRWQAADAALGLPSRLLVLDMLHDRRGTIWLLSPAGLYARPPDAAVFTKVGERHGAGRLAETADGRVWATEMDRRGLQLLFSPPEVSTPVPDTSAANSADFLFDRAGNLWLPGPDGVRQLVFEDGKTGVREFTSKQGLSGAVVAAFCQDREGNIWVVTENGLDQFRPRRLQALQLPHFQTFGAPLLAGSNGDVWIDQYYLSALGAAPALYGPGSRDDTLVTVLYRDPHGQLWSGARDGLWQVNGRQRVRVALPEKIAKHRFVVILSMLMDRQGGLWVSFAGDGVFLLKDGAWSAQGGIAALERQVVLSMTADAGGRLWFGTIDNTLFKLEGGKAARLGAAEGLAIDAVEAIVPYGAGLLLAGQPGLIWFDGKRFHTLKAAADARFSGTRGLLVTPEGRVWLNSVQGLQGIDAAEIARAVRQPDYPMRVLQFNFQDGLSGVVARESSIPRLARLSNGELLFSTSTGVYRLDPARYQTNRLPPPVIITNLWFDHVAHAPKNEVRLPASPSNLRIDYTALSLTLPQRVRFRYMLEGVDREWQDPGSGRSAYYTTLAPGRYRFRVVAANDDGVWNSEGAGLTLVVPPTLVQTVWFKLLCVAALALLVWVLWRLRLRAALQRMQRSFDVRVAERERIARDLHDTLLQSVQGLILVFRSIAGGMPAEAPSRPVMERALSLAEEVMLEGRDKVGDLRQSGQGGNLAEALAAHGLRRGEHESASFALQVHGKMRPLHGGVREEAFAIGREAINNAFLHAQAGRIDVALQYGERTFELTVQDDGQGAPDANDMARAGHWGIAGMRERALQLGATLTLRSAPGVGTCWTLRVAAPVAYDDTPAARMPDDHIQAGV